MKTSAYLLDTAKEHIEGKISIDEAQKRIQSYYEQRTDCTEIENDTKEADIVSTRDYDFAMEKQFSYEGLSVEHLAKFASDIWQIHLFSTKCIIEKCGRVNKWSLDRVLKAVRIQMGMEGEGHDGRGI